MNDANAPTNVPLGLALGFVGVVIFGASLPFTAMALSDFDAAFTTLARATGASFLALGSLLAMRRPFPREHLGGLAMAGCFLVFGFPGLSALALISVPASQGGVVLGIMPLMTAVLGALWTGERPSWLFWLAAALGTILVIWFVIGQDAVPPNVGHLWLLAAALSAALGYVISARLTKHLPGWEVMAWALVITSPISLVGMVATWPNDMANASMRSVGAIGFLAMFPMFLGFFAWNAGMALGGIARVSQIQLLQIFITVVLSALLLGEEITLRTLLFAIAVVVIVWIGRKAPIGHKEKPPGA